MKPYNVLYTTPTQCLEYYIPQCNVFSLMINFQCKLTDQEEKSCYGLLFIEIYIYIYIYIFVYTLSGFKQCYAACSFFVCLSVDALKCCQPGELVVANL